MVMMVALISYKGEKVGKVLFHKVPLLKHNEDEETKENLDRRMRENTEQQDFDGF